MNTIYTVKNKEGDIVYVGKTTRFAIRHYEHERYTRQLANFERKYLLFAAIGWENLRFE